MNVFPIIRMYLGNGQMVFAFRSKDFRSVFSEGTGCVVALDGAHSAHHMKRFTIKQITDAMALAYSDPNVAFIDIDEGVESAA
jgi:hypothetical protein